MCTNRYVSNRECTVDTEELDTLKQAEQKSYILFYVFGFLALACGGGITIRLDLDADAFRNTRDVKRAQSQYENETRMLESDIKRAMETVATCRAMQQPFARLEEAIGTLDAGVTLAMLQEVKAWDIGDALEAVSDHVESHPLARGEHLGATVVQGILNAKGTNPDDFYSLDAADVDVDPDVDVGVDHEAVEEREVKKMHEAHQAGLKTPASLETTGKIATKIRVIPGELDALKKQRQDLDTVSSHEARSRMEDHSGRKKAWYRISMAMRMFDVASDWGFLGIALRSDGAFYTQYELVEGNDFTAVQRACLSFCIIGTLAAVPDLVAYHRRFIGGIGIWNIAVIVAVVCCEDVPQIVLASIYVDTMGVVNTHVDGFIGITCFILSLISFVWNIKTIYTESLALWHAGEGPDTVPSFIWHAGEGPDTVPSIAHDSGEPDRVAMTVGGATVDRIASRDYTI